MAAWLVRGCGLWLTSAVNGGLNLSVLDGWWAEAYDGANGWAISGETDAEPVAQDARDGAELLRLLEDEVVPALYERDADGLAPAWIERVRTIGPAFGAGRMLEDYERRIYAR